MKKTISVLLIFATIILWVIPVSAEEDSGEYNAKAVLLAEVTTGQVLYSENADEKMPIASVTKIMSLLLAAEEIDDGGLSMSDIIVASAHANSMDGSVIWLEQGEKMLASDIIRSVVISSANDACVALAEHISGSEELFVKRMNEKAAELGMNNTHFSDCTGLTSQNHYSTAGDVAKMAAALRQYDYFDEFLLTRLTYVRQDTERATQLLNTNKLINKYEGLTGLKTGTTDEAGYCFVATAKRGDMELVAVVLGAEDENERFDIAERLLDYGFAEYQLFSPDFDEEKLPDVKVEDGTQKQVQVAADENISCVIPKGSAGDVTYLYDLPKSVDAPVSKGQRIGKIIVLLGDETLFLREITASENVEKLTFWHCLAQLFRAFFSI